MLSTLRILFVSELISILREKVALFWIFFFPFFFLAMMLMSNNQQGVLGHAQIEVVDLDSSALSQKYIERTKSFFSEGNSIKGDVLVTEVNPPRPPGVGVIRVTLPHGFDKAFHDKSAANVDVSYDYSGGLSTQVAARVFVLLTAKFNAEELGKGMTAEVIFKNSSNRHPVTLGQYLLTGIVVLSMMTAGMNNTCIAVVDRRERNTFKLMACLPVGPGVYLLAILAARLAVLSMASLILILGASYAYSIDMPTSFNQWVAAAGLIVIGGLTLVAMGLSMSSWIGRVQTAMFVCNIVYLSLMFFSDLTMPLNNYPSAVRPLLEMLPTSQFIMALRSILLQGSSLFDEWRSIAVMSMWMIGSMIFARATFRWHRV